MVVKKLPGADSVLMVYDLRDRLAATQDGVQRAKSPKEWSFNRYDELNRLILTGTIQSANTRVQMQTVVNGYTGTNLYETRNTSSIYHLSAFMILRKDDSLQLTASWTNTVG